MRWLNKSKTKAPRGGAWSSPYVRNLLRRPLYRGWGVYGTTEMRYNREESRVYVAMGRANRVAELDPASGKVLRWWPTGFRTWGIGLSPDETRLYAASGLSGTLTIIELKRGKVQNNVKLGARPWGGRASRLKHGPARTLANLRLRR